VAIDVQRIERWATILAGDRQLRVAPLWEIATRRTGVSIIVFNSGHRVGAR
jgi:hypothetical protein